MQVGDTIIKADLADVLGELQRQFAYNQIPYLQKIKDSGTDFMVQCPYHGNGQERKPSAGIRKSDGMFHCFACNAVHTLPEVISYCFGYDDIFGKEGLKWLVKNFNAVEVEVRDDVQIDVARNNTTNKGSILDNSDSNKSKWVSEEELDSYRYYHKYWESRGIIDDDIIELFDLGYDRETDSITFPVRDIKGNCLFVARRSVKSKLFNYPKGVEKPLYGLYELAQHWIEYEVEEHIEDGTIGINKGKDIFITESMIDCILLWQAGHYAVALNGTGSELQFEQLRRLPCRHLILATDNDSAGQFARERIRANVTNKLITEIDFPSDIKDIGDLGKAKRFSDIKNIKNWEVM